MNVDKLAPYAKAASAFVVGLGGFLTILSTCMADNIVTTEEAVSILTSLVTWLGGTFAVFQVPNKKVTETK
jgi:hypothetical protein